MQEIIALLRESIKDELFSKDERKLFRSRLAEKKFKSEQLKALRENIYQIANEHVNEKNFGFVIEWLRQAESSIRLLETVAPSGQAFFSPGEACRQAILTLIDQARHELQICVFTISDDIIAARLVKAHRRGVSIYILTDNDKSLDIGSDIKTLANSDIAIKMDVTTDHMHHKFMIVDNQKLLTGSYNWTRSAARVNHENILVTEDPVLLKAFRNEFNTLWTRMKEY